MRGLWTRFKAITAVIVSLCFVNVAFAQGAIQQSGPITAFHTPVWFGNGVLGDGGNVLSPALNAVALFNGANCPLSVSSQTSPGFTAAPYSLFTVCQTNASTTLSFSGVNGQTAPNVFFNIGGVTYAFPGPGNGNVTGPTSSTVNNVACWNSTSGTLLKDCGFAVGNVTGPVSSVNGNIACWNTTTGTSLKDCGVAIANLINGTPANAGSFTASGGETTFTVAIPVVGAGHLILTRNGLYQLPSVDFTTNGTTSITISPAAFTGEQFRWVTQ